MASQPSSSKTIVTANDLKRGIEEIYLNGLPAGARTGWRSLDECFRVCHGMLHIVTGVPGSGKSEFIDALAVNCMKNHNWRVAFFSPENKPYEAHYKKLAEKYNKREFFREHPIGSEMSEEEADRYMDTMGFFSPDRMVWIETSGDNSLDRIINDARSLVVDGLDALVIDPWNEIEHLRSQGRTARHSETEYICDCLTVLRNFARTNDVAVFLVAHPAKLSRDKNGVYPVPSPYDISGSAHWRNKADACITVHRPDMERHEADIHVQKIRFKHMGKLGCVTLKYSYETGVFFE